MSTPMKLDEFLSSQGSSFTATLEPIPEKPTQVKVTPYRDDRGCGCSSRFELPRDMIRSINPTGKYHYCCGKRLEVAVVEFTENASVSVADLIKRIEQPSEHTHAAPPYVPGENYIPPHAAGSGSRVSPLVGRWPIPGTPCEVECIEVCTRFCGPTGWDCCKWETRCTINCHGAWPNHAL
jgi:hypothetical protein